MQKNSSDCEIPSFAKVEAYDFDATRESLKIYEELNQIAEEIEKCRLGTC